MDKFLEMLKGLLKKMLESGQLYDLYVKTIRPKIAEKVADSASKWDDICLSAVDILAEKLLKPAPAVQEAPKVQ